MAELVTPGVPVDPQSVKRKRIAAERIIFSKMMGADSGLSLTTLAQLEKVDVLFDWETHGQSYRQRIYGVAQGDRPLALPAPL